jgi:hypothetical protein
VASDEGFASLFQSRISRYMYLYAFWALIGALHFSFILIFLGNQSWGSVLGARLASIIYASGTVDGRLCLQPIVLWYFPALIVALSLHFFAVKARCPYATLVIVFYGILAILVAGEALPWELESGLAGAVFIYIGYAARHGINFEKLLRRFPLWGGVVCMALGFLLSQSHVDFRSSSFGDIYRTLPSAVLTVTGLAVLFYRVPSCSVANRLADASILIFPAHTLCFWLYDIILGRILEWDRVVVPLYLYDSIKCIAVIGCLCGLSPLYKVWFGWVFSILSRRVRL